MRGIPDWSDMGFGMKWRFEGRRRGMAGYATIRYAPPPNSIYIYILLLLKEKMQSGVVEYEDFGRDLRGRWGMGVDSGWN